MMRIERFIDLAKKNGAKTQALAAMPIIQKLIAEDVTVDQFLQIVKLDAETAHMLACVPEIQKLIAKNVTLNQFLEIVNADAEIASLLAEAKEIQNKFYDPSHVLILMKTNADVGVKISRYKSIRENLILNDFPIKYPDLFGFISMPGELEYTSCQDKGENHLSLAASYGLKPSKEYNSVILFVVGYHFLNHFTQFNKFFKGLNIPASVSIEIGKMYLDSLNGSIPCLQRNCVKCSHCYRIERLYLNLVIRLAVTNMRIFSQAVWISMTNIISGLKTIISNSFLIYL